MVNGTEFVQWYYLIYLLPGGIALILLLLSALGGGMHHTHAGLGHGHSNLGHSNLGHSNLGHSNLGHSNTGHHGHAAPPAQAAHGQTSQGQTSQGQTSQGQTSQGQTSQGQTSQGQTSQGQTSHSQTAARGASPLTFFGLGRVPAPLVWGSGFLGWGVFGFWGTQFWQSHLPIGFVLPALLTALAGAVLTEKATVEAAARLLPRDETFALASVDLCGQTGTVAFPVDPVRGRVHVYDAHGTMHDVSARTLPGSAQIARGRTVLVADYDAARDQVVVEEMA